MLHFSQFGLWKTFNNKFSFLYSSVAINYVGVNYLYQKNIFLPFPGKTVKSPKTIPTILICKELYLLYEPFFMYLHWWKDCHCCFIEFCSLFPCLLLSRHNCIFSSLFSPSARSIRLMKTASFLYASCFISPFHWLPGKTCASPANY